ncbi:MAG: TonB family protein [Betaproteobacteria bacterium]|nr:TonB family protein [Betaproteobacteria bacterium]
MAMKLPSFLTRWFSNRQNKQLTGGFTVSITLHVLVMLIPLTVHEIVAARAPSLDVILVNARHDTAPKAPQALAQVNLDGGGDSSEAVRAASPLPPQSSTHEGNDLFDMMRGQQSAIRQVQPSQVMTQQDSSVAIAALKPPEDKPSTPQPTPGADLASTEAMLLKIEGEIAERTIAYSERPKRKQIGARTQEFRFARYIEGWRAKAERIGESHYPADARGKMYGSLVMTVSIRKDGSIEKVNIARRSKYPILNAAAERIVRLGEPYDEFPPEIARDTDILEITRTWTFTNDKLAVTTK